MQTLQARLKTFEQPHHLSKRQSTSKRSKKQDSAVQWPHSEPPVEEVCSDGSSM